MYDALHPPPRLLIWAVLLTGLFAAPSCTHWFAGGAPERLELGAQRVLDAAAEKEAQAYRPRVLSPRGFVQKNPEPPPPPAPQLVGTGALATLCAAAGPQAEAISRECGALRQVGWAKKASLTALGNGALIVLLILGGRGLARGPRQLQRVALVHAWGAVRWLTTAQLLTNTVLGLWVLYWGAVRFFGLEPHFFSLAFAGMVCIGALAMVAGLHDHQTLELRTWFDNAEVLGPDDAPELFAHLGALAERVGGVPPDQVILGLNPGLYIADEVAPWSGEPVPGRSLFLQFDLLKRLEREELDALLLHELSHVAPGASEQVRSLHRARQHLEQVRTSLSVNGAFLSPAHAVMRLYCEGVHSGIDARRQRAERAADALVAQHSSGETLGRGLVKATALQTFHARAWDENVEQEFRTGSAPSFAKALREGFERYSRSRQLVRDVRGAALTHPLDTHEPLEDRLRVLGQSALLAHLPLRFFEAPRGSWFRAIPRGEELERALWRAMERAEASGRAQAS